MQRPVLANPGLFLLAAAAAFSLCAGYGGFGATASFTDVSDMNRVFTELNAEWKGKDTFRMKSPVWWVGGHGAGLVDNITVGGGGAATYYNLRADSVEAEFFGARPSFELGYRIEPFEHGWLRPGLALSGTAWVCFVHSRESFSDPNFSRWFYAWNAGLMPFLEVMGRFRYRDDNAVGVFAKTGYLLPVHGPTWYGDANPPEFSPDGFTLEFGVRFESRPRGPLRI